MEKDTKKLIFFHKYKIIISAEMQQMGIPSFFYTAYSLKYTTIEKLVRLKIEVSKIK
jgi:hypothetical protein